MNTVSEHVKIYERVGGRLAVEAFEAGARLAAREFYNQIARHVNFYAHCNTGTADDVLRGLRLALNEAAKETGAWTGERGQQMAAQVAQMVEQFGSVFPGETETRIVNCAFCLRPFPIWQCFYIGIGTAFVCRECGA